MQSGRGVRRGERIVWCGPNSPGLVRMIHAARKLGAVAVPLDYRLPPEEAIRSPLRARRFWVATGFD